ncbi:MAG TPA: DUF2752 domain-containing protein [Acidimicrobiia bacterium]|nr:DUF2752 domain-containing protein [Acidimicrobiia bacterium]
MSAQLRHRLILWSPVAVVGALLVAPVGDEGTTICPFALSTGLACPGCGMTRAAASLVRADVSSAVAFHPLIPAVALLAATGWAWYLLRRAGRVQPMSNRMLNGILIGTALALVAVWVARLATGTLPAV